MSRFRKTSELFNDWICKRIIVKPVTIKAIRCDALSTATNIQAFLDLHKGQETAIELARLAYFEGYKQGKLSAKSPLP